jgi:hypothetical protein
MMSGQQQEARLQLYIGTALIRHTPHLQQRVLPSQVGRW